MTKQFEKFLRVRLKNGFANRDRELRKIEVGHHMIIDVPKLPL